MTTFLFIFGLCLAAGTLIYQYRGYERERSDTLDEVTLLLETLEREIASLTTHPTFSGLVASCPHLAKRGVIEALRTAEDVGACLMAAVAQLPLPEEARELLSGYFSTFGHRERCREREQTARLLAHMRELSQAERAVSKNRVRTFEVLVACVALCAAIVAW